MDVTGALQNLFSGGDSSGQPAQAQPTAQPQQAAYQAQAPVQSAIAPGAGVSAVAAGAKPSNVLAVLRPNAAAQSTPGGGFSPLAGLGAGSASDFANHSKFGALAAGFMSGMKGAQEQQAALAKQAEEHMKALFDIKNKQDTLNLQIQKQQQEAAQHAATLAQQKVRDANLADYYKGQNANGAAKAAGSGNAETLAAHELARFRHFQTLGGAKQFLTPAEAKKVQDGMDAWDKTNPAPKAGAPVGTPPAGAAPSPDDASPDPATAPTPAPDGSPAPDPNIDPSTGSVPTPPARPPGLGQPDPTADPSNANANPSGLADGITATGPKGEKMVYSAQTGQWTPLAAPQGATPSGSTDNANMAGP